MARIVVVEDEEDLQAVLEYNLTQAGHEVFGALSGVDGLQAVREKRPALVLLDLMLPDMTGIEVCKAVKADPNTRGVAVVMLTAKGEEIDRVVGFEVGADDYVVKPFSVREVLLRVTAILRRQDGLQESGNPVVEFGSLRFERDAHRVWIDGVLLELTALEFGLLMTFYDRRNRVQSRGTLLEDVWGIQSSITTRTVDTHVKRLREKLGAAREYIETVRGVGYRFIGSPDEARH